jgi:hypothetical protein
MIEKYRTNLNEGVRKIGNSMLGILENFTLYTEKIVPIIDQNEGFFCMDSSLGGFSKKITEHYPGKRLDNLLLVEKQLK